MEAQPVPAGIDAPNVGAWLAANVAGASPPFEYSLITGGRSNLTYAVTDGSGQRLVLRRPPLGHLLATAHDVIREYRIVAALGPTAVPVPPALAACGDPSVNGAPFAVTRFVDGVVLDSAEKASSLGPEGKRDLAFHLIDVLAELHSVDLKAVGLDDLSRHDGYIERQVRRWSRQWAGSKTRELPIVDEIEERLRRNIPEQHGVTLVHGDYRFGNCISDLDDRKIAAVLDWELCTLGDPLADLGHLGIYWYAPSQPPHTNDPTSGGGFPVFADLLERYASITGRDVSRVGYYQAFAAWRLAIIAEGVASRHLEHHPEDAAALKGSQAAVNGLMKFAAELLDRLPA